MDFRSTPVHRSLLEVKSTAGAEFVPVVANATILGMMLMGPHLMWWPAVTYIVHKFLQYLYKVDDQMLRVFWRYRVEGDHYDPWPRPNPVVKRPYGLGRDLPLC